jgi:hypothetical protein
VRLGVSLKLGRVWANSLGVNISAAAFLGGEQGPGSERAEERVRAERIEAPWIFQKRECKKANNLLQQQH